MQYLDKKEVGQRIRMLRKKRSMTQLQLAEYLNYTTERQLQRIERGETGCSIDKLMEIAQILGTSTDYLLFGRELKDDSQTDSFERLFKGKTKAEREFAYRLVKAALECLRQLF